MGYILIFIYGICHEIRLQITYKNGRHSPPHGPAIVFVDLLLMCLDHLFMWGTVCSCAGTVCSCAGTVCLCVDRLFIWGTVCSCAGTVCSCAGTVCLCGDRLLLCGDRRSRKRSQCYFCTYLAENQYYFKVNYRRYNISYLFQGMGYYVPVGNNGHTPYFHKSKNDRHMEAD